MNRTPKLKVVRPISGQLRIGEFKVYIGMYQQLVWILVEVKAQFRVSYEFHKLFSCGV